MKEIRGTAMLFLMVLTFVFMTVLWCVALGFGLYCLSRRLQDSPEGVRAISDLLLLLARKGEAKAKPPALVQKTKGTLM